MCIIAGVAHGVGYLDGPIDQLLGDSNQPPNTTAARTITPEQITELSDNFLSSQTQVSVPQVSLPTINLPTVTAPVPVLDAIEMSDQSDLANLSAELEDKVALQAQCRSEYGTVFASIQAYMSQTGAIPDHPDVLVTSGWLEEHPDGWSARWEWDVNEFGLAVVPVAGTLCAD